MSEMESTADQTIDKQADTTGAAIDKRVRLTVSFSAEEWEMLNKLAQKIRRNKTDSIRRAVEFVHDYFVDDKDMPNRKVGGF